MEEFLILQPGKNTESLNKREIQAQQGLRTGANAHECCLSGYLAWLACIGQWSCVQGQEDKSGFESLLGVFSVAAG